MADAGRTNDFVKCSNRASWGSRPCARLARAWRARPAPARHARARGDRARRSLLCVVCVMVRYALVASLVGAGVIWQNPITKNNIVILKTTK